MARGWESKSVEAQVSDFQAATPNNRKAAMTEEQAGAARQRNVLLLARAHVESALQANPNPRYREQLTQALAHIDVQLAELPSAPQKD